MNPIYTNPNMIYSIDGKSCYVTEESFHAQARRLGHYPKVGLFVEDLDGEELCPPSPRKDTTRPSFHRESSPSLMSRTLNARANAAQLKNSQRVRPEISNANQGQPSFMALSPPSNYSYRHSHNALSNEEGPSSPSDSDSGSEYGSGVAPSRSPASQARKLKKRPGPGCVPYSKASSPTQALISRHLSSSRPPNSSGSSNSTSSSPSIPSSPSGGSETSDDGKPYYVVQDKKVGKQKYVCATCPDYSTYALGDLTRHFEALVHSKPSHRCVDECGQAFTRKDAVIRHMRTKHPKWKIDYDEVTKQAFWRQGARRSGC